LGVEAEAVAAGLRVGAHHRRAIQEVLQVGPREFEQLFEYSRHSFSSRGLMARRRGARGG
jgi:hypothetical protein